MSAPAPSMMRITDGREGIMEAPVGRSREFQLKAEETRVPPYVVVGMYHIRFLHVVIIYAYAYDHVIVCFHVRVR